MQTIKKFVVLTCATWGMQASIAHADQATNAIYAEKRAAGDSSWKRPG